MQANVDFVRENNVDIGVSVSNGATRAIVILMVHDSIIVGNFGVFGGLFNIFIGVTFSNYNVPIASIDRQKMVTQVLIASSMHRKKNVVQVLEFGIGGSGFEMESKGAFWNEMFEKELPKYKDHLDLIFPCHPLETINVNTTFGHVFSHLHNCTINITYVIDSKSMPTLGIPSGGDKL
jgi:hypothetical protein